MTNPEMLSFDARRMIHGGFERPVKA
jgi:uncharacterized protein YbaA (DUF1428 family)